METALIIIIGFLFIAVVVLFCTMAIYTHKRFDDLVKMVNKNGTDNCKSHNKFIDDLTKIHSNLDIVNENLIICDKNIHGLKDEVETLKTK